MAKINQIKRILFLLCWACINCALSAQSIQPQNKITDDQKHYIAGYGISSFTSYTIYFLTDRPVISAAAGCLTAAAAGILKETVNDYHFKNGNPDILDAVTTAWGSLAASLTITVVIDIERKNNKFHFLHKKKYKTIYYYNEM